MRLAILTTPPALAILLLGCGPGVPEVKAASALRAEEPTEEVDEVQKIEKTDAEWREELTEDEYRVLREQGTERAFTGEYYETDEPGIYVCAGCGLPLFRAETKFHSGTGWPSFFDFIPGHIEQQTDTSHGMSRNEVHCARCGGHLGHVFDDGPKPTGQRYCINSISLDLEPAQGNASQDQQVD